MLPSILEKYYKIVPDEVSHNSYNTSQVDESCTLLHWIQCNILYDNKIYHY